MYAAKANALKDLSSTLPLTCKRFVQSEEYDRILATCILYFIARFQLEFLEKALAKAERQHLDDYNPVAVALKLQDLAEEAHKMRGNLSPMYSMVRARCLSRRPATSPAAWAVTLDGLAGREVAAPAASARLTTMR